MKKFILTTLSAIALSAGAAQAQPDYQTSNLYASVLGGWSSHPALSIGGTQNAMQDGYNVGARLGYDLTGLPVTGFSTEADYFYNQSNYSGASGAQLGSSSFMGNLIYHVPTASAWGFYGGAGLGAVHDNLNGSLHGSSTVLGWQALGGVDYAFNPTTAMFVEYRYQNAHDADIGALRGVGNTSNNLSVGVKFRL